jgi:pantetheine-phosphate adenylyltransferase
MTSAIYPGTFDPITYGHLDLIERSLKIFSHLVVAVGHNPEKTPLFSTEDRVDMIRQATSDYAKVEVTQYSGLLVDFAEERQIFSVVRSLRTTTEYEVELSMAVANRQLNPNLEVVFLTPSLEYTYLSSTIVREIAQFGGDITPFVPPLIAKKLRDRFNKEAGG